MSELISEYATQRVTLERAVRDESGEPTGDSYSGAQHEDPEEIEAVYQPYSGRVTTATGAQVQVESQVLSETEILTADKVEGYVVKRADPLIDFDGQTIGYEAFL